MLQEEKPKWLIRCQTNWPRPNKLLKIDSAHLSEDGMTNIDGNRATLVG